MGDNKEYKKIFYERRYGIGNVYVRQKGFNFVEFIYRKLERFELHREDAADRFIVNGERLLDIGCGNGSFIFKVKDKFKEIHGVDITSNRISEAKRLKAKMHQEADITFKTVDIDSGLPYEDGYFDAITCLSVLEHIYDPYFIISEVHRVLRKGGVFILEVPNIAWLPRRISLIFGNLPETSNDDGWDGGHLHSFTVGSLRDFLVTHGFKIMCISGAGIFSSIRNYWVSLLSGDIIIKAEKMGKGEGRQ